MTIVCYIRSESSLKFIIPFTKALNRIGHRAIITGNPTIETIKRYNPDIILTTSSDLRHAALKNMDWLLESTGIPYISIWFQTPLRNLYTLKKLTSSLHSGMLIPDSTDAETLKNFGFKNVFYFPISWWVDTDYFKPMPVESPYSHNIAWDCTFEPYVHVQRRFKNKYSSDYEKAVIEKAVETFLLHRGSYVNMFDFLKKTTDIDIYSNEFMTLQNDLLFLQKSLEREYILNLLSKNNLTLHIYGGFSIDHNRANFNHLLKTPRGIVIHDYIDTFKELPKLYSSAKILLSRMMYPSGVHDRLFCAAATKGFVLSEWKDDAAKAFEPGKEIIMYNDIQELPGLIKYYLKHEDERKKIAEAAHKRFMAEHTPLHRAKEFVEIVKGLI